MKLGLIIPSFYPAVIYGGPIFSSLYASQELAQLNNMDVYVSTTNANMHSRLDVDVGKWVRLQKCLYVKYYNETIINYLSLSLLLNIWRDINAVDIVHIQSIFSTPTPASLSYAFLMKKPVLLSPRGQFGEWCLQNGSPFKKYWLNWFIKPFIKNTSWHATSEQEKTEILSIFPNSIIYVIPNGIDYDSYQKNTYYSSDDFVVKFICKTLNTSKIIVSIGRLHKKKGFDILIDSFVHVLEHYPLAKLFIAGQDEGERKNLEQQIQVNNLFDSVFLIGPISGQEKIDFLTNADLFVLPSHNENFGNVYLESLASGTPIVASTNTPWQQVMTYNCGKWVKNNVIETASAVLDILEQDRGIMRENSKSLAKQYDWASIAMQFSSVYHTIINNI